MSEFKDSFSVSGILIKNFGRTMTREEFFGFLFREYIDDVKSNGFLGHEWSSFSDCLPFRTVAQASELAVHASHFSISLYYKPTSRMKENIRYMVGIPFDIDWGKKGVQATGSEVWHWVKKHTGLEISALWKSKTPWCYHGVLRIEMMVGTPKSIHLLEWVAKQIAIKINGDVGGSNSNQWLRVHTKFGFQKYSDKIYDIDELKRFLPSTEELEQRHKAINSGVTSLEKYRVENHPAIKKLLSGDLVGWRNNACFTAALMLKVMGYGQEEAYEKLSGEFFSNVNGVGWDATFSLAEVKSTVKSAYSGKYMGPSKEWILNCTGEEFPYNLTYVRTKYKKAEEVRVAIVDYLREYDGLVVIKQQELADTIGMPFASVKRALKWLKDNEVIDFESQRGGNKNVGTTFKLLQNDAFSKNNNVVIQTDFGYQELDENMG